MLSAELIGVLLSKRARTQDAAIREKARLHIADTLGISMAAARGSPIAAMVLDSMCSGGAAGDCSVIGHSQRLPPALAAMANSALAHAMDYDDIHDTARIHPTAVTLAAALATAEMANADGSAVVDGVILGNEVMTRLGFLLKPLGTGPGADWFLSQTFGYFGACLAAGVVLGMSQEQLVGAFGLAYMQLAGSKEPAFGIGANSRAIYTGFAAQAGVQAALLARSGMIGPASALDGKAGMFPLYLGMMPSHSQLDTLLQEDGWVWQDTSVKPWPCCRSSHPYVSVALELAAQDIRPERIRQVKVAVTPAGARLCRPLEARRNPATLADAKYSIPFVSAFALVHGRVELTNLDDEALHDAAVLQVASRVEFEETITDRPGPAPARIAVTFDDGSTKTAELRDGLRLNDARLREKFLSCLAYVDLADRATDAWERIQSIDVLKARDIQAALAPVNHSAVVA